MPGLKKLRIRSMKRGLTIPRKCTVSVRFLKIKIKINYE